MAKLEDIFDDKDGVPKSSQESGRMRRPKREGA